MYHATRVLYVERGKGFRRILKRPKNVFDYLRQATQSGTYRTPEEIEMMQAADEDIGPNADEIEPERRTRINIVRGSSIHDYPVNYQILLQHPPMPEPLKPIKEITRNKNVIPRNKWKRLYHNYIRQATEPPPDPLKGKLQAQLRGKGLPKRTQTELLKLTEDYYHRYMAMKEGANKTDIAKQYYYDYLPKGKKSDFVELTAQYYFRYRSHYAQRDWHAHLEAEELEAADNIADADNSSDYYYQTLLGIPPPEDMTEKLLFNKETAQQHAYKAAAEHYQLERKGDDARNDADTIAEIDEILSYAMLDKKHETVHDADIIAQINDLMFKASGSVGHETRTDADIIAQVDDILFNAIRGETARVVKNATEAKVWREQHADGQNVVEKIKQSKQVVEGEPDKQAMQTMENEFIHNLQENPRTWLALQKWSDRLRRVPYSQWTIGAATALDHWIASEVLKMSEETWEALLGGVNLFGNDKANEEMGGAVVAARQALFPETLLDPRLTPEDYDDDEEFSDLESEGLLDEDTKGLSNFGDESKKGEVVVEDLLSKLGDLIEEEGKGKEATDQLATKEQEELQRTDEKRILMTKELQEWRREHHAGKLDEDAFYGWSRRYMEVLNIDKNAVSFEDFKESILADLPLDQESSAAFWDAISKGDPGSDGYASMSLEQRSVAARYCVDPNNPKALWNLAALRPLLDEYYPEEDREVFLDKYADILLEGVPLKHVVVSDEGAPSSSLPPSWAKTFPAGARVQLMNLAYRRTLNEAGQVNDPYFYWKEHKVGRARYEEKLFRSKRLGLLYGQDFGEEEMHGKDNEEDLEELVDDGEHDDILPYDDDDGMDTGEEEGEVEEGKELEDWEGVYEEDLEIPIKDDFNNDDDTR